MILNYLHEEYENQVWKLVELADHEFVPSLSTRYSTTQGDLVSGTEITNEGPWKYFEELKKQQNLLCIKEEMVAGFMSYIPNHSLLIPGINEKKNVCYISTVIVHPSYRGQRIAEKLYRKLMQISTEPLATRTWSTNNAHIHVLEKLEFDLLATLKNDRGKNIDTVYYIKNDMREVTNI